MANRATPPARIMPKLTAMSPYEIYLRQVRGIFDAVRFGNRGMDYIPPHMGGLLSQRAIIEEVAVLEITDFEVK